MKAAMLVMVEIPQDLWSTFPAQRSLNSLSTDAVGNERRIRKGVAAGRERARYTQLCNWIEATTLSLQHDGRAAASLIWQDGTASRTVAAYVQLVEFLQEHADLFGILNKVIQDPTTIHTAPVPRNDEPQRRKFSFLKWLATFFGVSRGNKSSSNQSASNVSAPVQTPRRTLDQEMTRPLTPRVDRPNTVGRTFFRPGEDVSEQVAIFGRLTVERLELLGVSLPRAELSALARLATEKADFFRQAHGRRSAIVEILAMNAAPHGGSQRGET